MDAIERLRAWLRDRHELRAERLEEGEEARREGGEQTMTLHGRAGDIVEHFENE